MKKTTAKVSEDLRPEYDLDYSKAKPNRFAGRIAERVVVVLDPDISEVFTTPESVNAALRALISAIPGDHRKKTSPAVRE
ncbi:MAG: hypothetical protein RBS68_12475 [Anaerolineales bacterium]|jgi:hypothetical protein|nr:hypothetical protein [Anaerolineales bacterium]